MFVTQYDLLFICVKRCESLPQLERQNNAITSNLPSKASRILHYSTSLFEGKKPHNI